MITTAAVGTVYPRRVMIMKNNLMKAKKKKKKIKINFIKEDLQTVKFKYDNYNDDPRPNAKILDFEYPGRQGQKTYGQRKDMLGYNLNYFKNKRYAAKAIDEIDTFARMLSADKSEKYRRIKHFYPETLEFIRRYKREAVNKLKRKKGIIYKSTDYDELVKLDNEPF